MQIKIEAIKNTVNERFLNNTNASLPRICTKDVFVPFPFGGVLGKIKLRNPNTTDATAAILKVNTSCSGPILKTLSIIQPVTIHPIVPNTRIFANSLVVSLICRNATEFTSASVGAKQSEYNRMIQ